MLFANILLAFTLTPLAASQLSDLVLRDDAVADLHLSDQTPMEPGNLTFAFDELPGEFDLFKRQGRCNPGWSMYQVSSHPPTARSNIINSALFSTRLLQNRRHLYPNRLLSGKSTSLRCSQMLQSRHGDLLSRRHRCVS